MSGRSRPTGPPTGSARRLLALAAVLALAATACGRVVELSLPRLDAAPRDPPEQSLVYDADGRRLATLRTRYRERVGLEQIPDVLEQAVVATEDKRFFTHGGVDARAIVRAALRNVAAGRVVQGGSTITQQLVEQLYLPDAPATPETKLREALLARRMEQQRSKRGILEEYLNTVYLGNGAYGVQAAARTYWRTDVSELGLARAALLAGLIRRPESLDPADNPAAAARRREQVLDLMVARGDIDRTRASDAAARPVSARPRPPAPETREPHWVDFVIRTLLDDPRFGDTEQERAARLFGGGLRIHTTLRPRLQDAARRVMSETLDGPGAPDAAIATVEPGTGRILAAVGSRPYSSLQFGLATQARRQPGSTFKAFVLTAAVAAGSGPEEVVDGSQATLRTTSGPWTVRNYSREDYPRLTLEQATRYSVNAAFARLILELGPGRVAGLARAMGVRAPINEDPAIALGALREGLAPLDMARAFATLANRGVRVPASPIDRIENAAGEVIWRPERRERQVVAPSAAHVTTDILRAVVQRGTGVRAQLPSRQVAGKTGTTQNHADAWFSGYTPRLSTAVWVGHAEGRRPMDAVPGVGRVTGGTLPARMWADYTARALAGTEPAEFQLPAEHYEVVEIDPETGLRAAPWCPGEPTPLPRAIAPTRTCPSPAPAPAPAAEGTSPSPSPTATASPAPAPSASDGAPAPAPTGTASPAPAAGTPGPTGPPQTGPTPAPSPAPTG